jgi:catechol 2,3-dioxygenase-like lactoylglutathione lyase family enzyme
MGTLKRVAPIFAVRDLDATLAHYQRLGFSTRTYEGGGYAFVSRERVEIHLGLVPADHHQVGSAYLFVQDADALAEEWRAAGVELYSPVDTEWRQHEGAVVDPDGNVIRFGSRVRSTRSEP